MTGDLHPALRRDRSGSARCREADSGQNAVTLASHALSLGGRPAWLEEGWAEAFNDPAVSSPGSAGGRSGAAFRFSSDEHRPTVWLRGEHDLSTDLLVACTLDKAMLSARSDVVIDVSEASVHGHRPVAEQFARPAAPSRCPLTRPARNAA
jgi:hypothetical protein